MLLHEIVDTAAAAAPHTTALVAGDERWSFAELQERVVTMSQGLRQLTRPGDRVLVLSDNHPAVVTALYAVPRAGAIATFANTRHTARELRELVDATTPTLVLGSAEHLARLLPALDGATSIATIVALDADLDGADRAARHSLGLVDTAAPPAPVELEPLTLQDHDAAWLIHTSGTTGRAKGARLTHRSLMAAVTNTAIARPMSDDDVYLFPFPLFHVAAYNVLHSHLRRRPVVLLPRFDAETVLELVPAERVTTCSLAPTMLSMLLDHPRREGADLSSLRQISYGASAMPLDLLRRVSVELPACGLAQGYGMTELSGNAVFLDPEAHRRALADAPHLLAAAGRPGPLVALRIAHDDGRAVEPGDVGEILVRGDQVCDGYWLAPEASAAARIGEWFRTGDLGRIDDEGYLYVVDRKKDIIISGGENVASREVEDVLSTHPDLRQVAVVGVPDLTWGERVCAVVVPHDGVELHPGEIVEWSDGRLAGFKRPRRVVVVQELPVNASGKVDKVQLRAVLADEPDRA
jgi:acyl-CoA synthetase (AMP-forming)/AMP-acid ligase II